MISQTAEYALRAVAYLAQKRDRPRTIVEIAAETRVPAGYLAKVMQNLARHGILHSLRGKSGGYSLAKPPSEISILEVVQAVDPIVRITRCPLGNPAHRDHLCELHRQLDEAAADIEARFRACKLSHLLVSPAFASSED